MKLVKFFQSLWPVWFPYPSAWFQAVISVILGVGASYAASAVLPEVASLPSTKAVGFRLFLALLILAAPFVLYAYVYSFFWGDAPAGWPARIPSPKSLWEGFFAFSTFSVTLWFGLIVAIFLSRDWSLPVSQTVANISALAWLSSAAYLYQAKFFIWRGIIGELEEKARGDEAAGLPPRYRLGKSAAAVKPTAQNPPVRVKPAVKGKVKVVSQDDPFGEFKP